MLHPLVCGLQAAQRPCTLIGLSVISLHQPVVSMCSSSNVVQGPSPDEVALVEGGRQLGFEFLSRSMQGITLRMLGHEATFEVLNMMEFSSERGRMSVIARSPDGTIRLFAKGADSKMLSIVNKNTDVELLERTAKNLHLFATQVLPI